jgi:O-antigen/teichoic acid export membrane protein
LCYYIPDGLHIVPIILISAFLTGVLFNMNVWYKLTGKTYYGVYIIGSGAVITILLNAFFIPRYGYYGSALTHLISNIVMIFISYMFGKKYYAIPYEWKKVVIYVFMGFILYITASYSHFNSLLINTIKNSLLFFVFLFIVIKKEDLIGVFIKGDYENKNN